MILCVCNNVSERQWQQALAAHDHDLRAAADACGAGQCCGTCQEELIMKAQGGSMPRLAWVGWALPE